MPRTAIEIEEKIQELENEIMLIKGANHDWITNESVMQAIRANRENITALTIQLNSNQQGKKYFILFTSCIYFIIAVLKVDDFTKRIRLLEHKNEILEHKNEILEQKSEILEHKNEILEHKSEILEQKVDDLKVPLPARFTDNVKMSSVKIVRNDNTSAGVGFYVSHNKIISCAHVFECLGELKSVKQAADFTFRCINFEQEIVSLTLTNFSKKTDIAVFSTSTESGHFLTV